MPAAFAATLVVPLDEPFVVAPFTADPLTASSTSATCPFTAPFEAVRARAAVVDFAAAVDFEAVARLVVVVFLAAAGRAMDPDLSDSVTTT